MECAVIAMSSCSTGGFEMRKGRRRVSSSVCVGMHGGGSIGIGDHHSVLGVKKNASKGEVKIAYRKLARLYHPDVCKDGEGEQRFKLINRAYESIIKDYKCFQTEVGYVNDIEDLFQTGNTEAIPDFLFNGEWFEWLNMNDSNMHHHHHDPTTLMFGQSYEELGTEWLNF